MNDSFAPRPLDRYTQFTELAAVIHRFLGRAIMPIVGLLLAIVLVLIVTDNPGWLAFGIMAAGTIVALTAWKSEGIGLPFVPVFAIQHMITYGTPIATQNYTIVSYSSDRMTQAGIEVCVFLFVMTLAWRAGMRVFQARHTYVYALKAFSREGSHVRTRMGVGLVALVTVYNVLDSLHFVAAILAMLPGGAGSLVSALVKATMMGGYFLLSVSIGSDEAPRGIRGFLWASLALNALIITSTFLLSATTNLFASVIIGLFWGSGRMPWRFLVVIAAILSFLHLGKFEMRNRYWTADAPSMDTSLFNLPRHYGEWIDASFRNLTGGEDRNVSLFKKDRNKTPSMLARVNNAQNLLYAIEAVEGRSIPVLKGATYALIPPLLMPRILWPDKPRVHEGQILLNVHFGRQSLSDTFRTYIAWGLLPEAYGNFGPIYGAIFLGLVLGVLFARVETATAFKPLLSLEGLVVFAVFIELTVSFEMVASVLTTSVFQSAVIIALACIPFVHRMHLVRPTDEAEDEF